MCQAVGEEFFLGRRWLWMMVWRWAANSDLAPSEALGQMWSVIWTVEGMLSARRVAHQITSPQDVHQDFSAYSAGYQTCLAYLCEHVMLDFLWRLTQWGGGIYSNIDTTHRLMTLLTQFAAERWPRGVDHTEVTINRADCFSFPLLPSRGTHKCLRFSFSTC